MLSEFKYKNLLAVLAIIAVFASSLIFSAALYFKNHKTKITVEERVVHIEQGSGLAEIAGKLLEDGLIRSGVMFKLYAFIFGKAHLLKPGTYDLNTGMGMGEIILILVQGPSREVSITIPEGSNKWDIDSLLSEGEVLAPRELIAFLDKEKDDLEGYLFPDTYRFYRNSSPMEVVQKMRQNFDEKANPILMRDEKNLYSNLILASLLEKEVPDFEDRKIVAGLLLKRLKIGMGLQVDATICYTKLKQAEELKKEIPQSCHPFGAIDFKIDSPYNTYLHRGLPPTPIANPGLEAIRAALDPQDSPFWYYLSDPKTKKTIFSKTLDEHRENRVKYL